MGDEEAASGQQGPGPSPGPSDGSQSGADQAAGDAQGQGHGHGQHNQLDDSLFNQLGSKYNSGDYQGAINMVKPLVDSQTTDANWGRGAYGLVMCYDALNQFNDAADYMQRIVNQIGTHPNRQAYESQLDGYRHGRNWTGDFLLY